ncbi:MAG: L,D-transpeptidase [Rhizobiaceae bacterium]|jgi:lipoprotein-anchoring transpeptidase ErfK/SrfK|nr:L,D-transpeptidase [Rhizobiaceae bacterium]
MQSFKLVISLVVALVVAATAVPASAADLVARVDVSAQRMTVSYRGEVLHVWPVSTGRKGYRTPRGQWKPTRMHQRYFSRKYDNAPMPYSVFFTGGYAIHGTTKVKSLGRPASHGCVRLHTANAAAFYGMVQRIGRKNTRIVVTN